MTDDDFKRQMVCLLPAGVLLTDESWTVIHDHWISSGRKFLNAEEVTSLIASAESSND